MKAILPILFTFLTSLSLFGHSPDQSYLVMRVYADGIGGRVEMTAKDINKAIGSNMPDDLTMDVLRPHIAQLQAYIREHLSFNMGGKEYNFTYTDAEVLDLNEMEDFAQINFDLDGVQEVGDAIDIRFDVLLDAFPKHRDILVVEYNWKAGIVDNESLISAIFSPGDTEQTLSLKDASILKGFIALIKLGVWHIWIGLDHILFILALILPSVVRRREDEQNDLTSRTWIPVPAFKPAFWYIIKIITFFTIAHSITLALAALGIIDLPSRMVESIIAISIALAAFHNIVPIFGKKEWLIAFLFGLFHGFGFASVLGEKGMDGDFLVLSLLGFNLGVEVGQVLIICMIFPVLYMIRKSKYYDHLVKYGSMILIFISFYWFAERAFDIDLQLGAYFWKVKEMILG